MRAPRRPAAPIVLTEADMEEANRIMDEVGIPVHNSLSGMLSHLSNASGGIPDFAREALIRHGADRKMVEEAHDQGVRARQDNPPEPDDDLDGLSF